jgi:hypothetical protein
LASSIESYISLLSSSAIISHLFIVSPALKLTFVIVHSLVNFKLCSSTNSDTHETSIMFFILHVSTVKIAHEFDFVFEVLEGGKKTCN